MLPGFRRRGPFLRLLLSRGLRGVLLLKDEGRGLVRSSGGESLGRDRTFVQVSVRLVDVMLRCGT